MKILKGHTDTVIIILKNWLINNQLLIINIKGYVSELLK